MGLFKFACGRCWDYDCKCTPEELSEYNKQCEINRSNFTEPKKSATVPVVSPGDLVIKDSVEFIIRDVIDGVAIGEKITNDPTEVDFRISIREPYQKMVCNKLS